jgi:hypothetical protein
VFNAPSFKCGTLWKPYTETQLARKAKNRVWGVATVQLPNKGSKVYCFEGAREDVLSHELGIGDDEGRARIVPADKVVCFRVIDKTAQREWRLAQRMREERGRRMGGGAYAWSLLRKAGTRGCGCWKAGSCAAEACSAMVR